MVIDIDNYSIGNIFQYFKEYIEFIENSTKNYIHCMTGISRSSSIVIS